MSFGLCFAVVFHGAMLSYTPTLGAVEGQTMTFHKVKPSDLTQCLNGVQGKAQEIAAELGAMNQRVEDTHYVGENANTFTKGMNSQVDAFVLAQTQNLNTIISTVTNNVNVVATKLGHSGFGAPGMVEVPKPNEAQTKAGEEAESQEIKTDQVQQLGRDVTSHMEKVASLFSEIGPHVIGASDWQGPEKESTLEDVSSNVASVVLPDIQASSAELSGFITKQCDEMESNGHAPAGAR